MLPVSAMDSKRVACVLAMVGGMSALYMDATEPDWQLRKPCRAGVGTPLIVAATMGGLELVSKNYIETNFFTATPIGQSIKIMISVIAVASFCQYLGVYKQMAQDTKRIVVYLKGLLCGTLLVLPFCSDL